MIPPFRTRTREFREGAAVLELDGEIDLSTAPMVEAQFQSLVNRGITNVVIDATQVTFMDSSGLAALLTGEKLIHSRGSAVHLVPSAHVRRLLELISTEALLSTEFETVEEAIAALDRETS